MIKSFKKDNLKISVFKTRTEMGKAAAEDIAACIERLLKQKESINCDCRWGIWTRQYGICGGAVTERNA